MPVRTQHELNDRLDKEIAWRKRELSEIGLIAQRSGGLLQETLIRGGICLLYAHWEGFVGYASRRYVEYVATRRLKYDELKTSFRVVGLQSKIMRSFQQFNVQSIRDLFEVVLDDESRFDRGSDLDIDTRSNLDSKVFRDLLYLVGVDGSGYATKHKFIDQKLVGNRNRIAHGERVSMSSEDYHDLHHTVIELMEQFREDISNAANVQGYLTGI